MAVIYSDNDFADYEEKSFDSISKLSQSGIFTNKQVQEIKKHFLLSNDLKTVENSEICVYPTIEDFAIYEVLDGWYQLRDFVDKGLNGEPDPTDFINYKELGYALAQSWDESEYLLLDDGKVIQLLG